MKTNKNANINSEKVNPKRKKIIQYFICLVGAVLLYSIVAFNQRNDKVFSCKLRVEGLNSDDFVITSTLPDVIRITVKDKQNILDSITEEDFNVRLNLSGINDQDSHTLPIEWDMPKAFLQMRNSMLFSTVELNPAKITVNIENIQQKNVPIQINTKGSPADGYIVQGRQLDINYARIQGPAGIINNIQSVKTEAINIEKAMDSVINQDVGFISPSPLVTFVGKTTAKATVKIVRDIETLTYTYNSIEINNLKKYLKATYNIDDRITVTVSGDKKTLDSLQKTSIILNVDCRNISYAGEYSTRININLPLNVTLVSVKPDVIKLSITEETENMPLRINSIRVNEPADTSTTTTSTTTTVQQEETKPQEEEQPQQKRGGWGRKK